MADRTKDAEDGELLEDRVEDEMNFNKDMLVNSDKDFFHSNNKANPAITTKIVVDSDKIMESKVTNLEDSLYDDLDLDLVDDQPDIAIDDLYDFSADNNVVKDEDSQDGLYDEIFCPPPVPVTKAAVKASKARVEVDEELETYKFKNVELQVNFIH